MQRIASGVLAALVVLSSPADGQDVSSEGGRGCFGAPAVGLTTLRGHVSLTLGGRGGCHVRRTVTLGIAAYATASEIDAKAAIYPALPYPLDVKLETFGVEVEYLRPFGRAASFTFGALLGGGALHYMKNGTAEQEGETDFTLAAHPTVGLEYRFPRGLGLALAAGYRILSGVELPGLSAGDAAGPSLTLSLKLGGR